MNAVFTGHPMLGRSPGRRKDEESGGKREEELSRPKKCPELGWELTGTRRKPQAARAGRSRKLVFLQMRG